MDPLQAAVLRVKLQSLDSWNARRQLVAERYLKELSIAGIDLPDIPTYAKTSWHLFVIRVDDRDELRSFLAQRGIETQIHYPLSPMWQEAYAGDYKELRQEFHATRKLDETLLSLPMGPHLGQAEQHATIESIKEFFAKNRN